MLFCGTFRQSLLVLTLVGCPKAIKNFLLLKEFLLLKVSMNFSNRANKDFSSKQILLTERAESVVCLGFNCEESK